MSEDTPTTAHPVRIMSRERWSRTALNAAPPEYRFGASTWPL